jgi:hypothetical protein
MMGRDNASTLPPELARDTSKVLESNHKPTLARDAFLIGGQLDRPEGRRAQASSRSATHKWGRWPRVVARESDAYAKPLTPAGVIDAIARLEAMASGKAKFSWTAYEHAICAGLQRDLDTLRRRMGAQTNTARLMAQLGLGIGSAPRHRHTIATPRTIVRRLKACFDALGVPADRRLIPAMVYVRRNGSEGWCEIGDPLPRGARPKMGLASDETFDRMVARGLLPVGSTNHSNYATEESLSAFGHDIIGHVTGYMEYSPLMGAFIDAAREREHRDGRSAGRDRRWYQASETMAHIPRRHVEVVRSMLELPTTQHPSIDDIEAHLRGLTPEAQRALAARLRARVLPCVVDLGGAARDYTNSTTHSISLLLERLLTSTVTTGQLSRPGVAAENVAVRCLAQAQAAMLTLCELTPERWIREATAESVEPDSLTRRLFLLELPLFGRTMSNYPRIYWSAADRLAYRAKLLPEDGVTRSLNDDAARVLLRDQEFGKLPFDFREESAARLEPQDIDRLAACSGFRKLLYVDDGRALVDSQVYFFDFTPAGLERLAWHLGRVYADQGRGTSTAEPRAHCRMLVTQLACRRKGSFDLEACLAALTSGLRRDPSLTRWPVEPN